MALILADFTDHFELVLPFFLMFLSFYLATLLGNVGMIILIYVDTQLRTPNYYFLSHIALLDACYTSFVTPQILATLTTAKMAISYGRCAATFLHHLCRYGMLPADSDGQWLLCCH